MIERARKICDLNPIEIRERLQVQARREAESLADAEKLSLTRTKDFAVIRKSKTGNKNMPKELVLYCEKLLGHFRDVAIKQNGDEAASFIWYENEPFEAEAAVCLTYHLAEYSVPNIRVYVSETGVSLDLMVLAKYFFGLKEVRIRQKYPGCC